MFCLFLSFCFVFVFFSLLSLIVVLLIATQAWFMLNIYVYITHTWYMSHGLCYTWFTSPVWISRGDTKYHIGSDTKYYVGDTKGYTVETKGYVGDTKCYLSGDIKGYD